VHYAAYPAKSKTTGNPIPGKLMEIGYVHEIPEVRIIFRTPFPDIVLINKREKIAILLDAKVDLPEKPVENISKKFSDITFDIVYEHFGGNYEIECVILTYESKYHKFIDYLSPIEQKIGKPMFLWYATDRPVPYGTEEAFLIKKRGTPIHRDPELETALSHGVPILLDRYLPKPLLDIHSKDRHIFIELAFALFLKSTERMFSKEPEDIRIRTFLERFKRDYPSPLPLERLIRGLKDVVAVFPEIGEISRSEAVLKIKTARNLDVDRFLRMLDEVSRLEKGEYKRYIRKHTEKKIKSS